MAHVIEKLETCSKILGVRNGMICFDRIDADYVNSLDPSTGKTYPMYCPEGLEFMPLDHVCPECGPTWANVKSNNWKRWTVCGFCGHEFSECDTEYSKAWAREWDKRHPQATMRRDRDMEE